LATDQQHRLSHTASHFKNINSKEKTQCMENEERQLLIVLLHIRLYDLSEILSALDQNDF